MATRCPSKPRSPTRFRRGSSRRRARSAPGGKATRAARRCLAATRSTTWISTVKGIAGTLTSTGEFGGQLDRIDVKGETHTPDFRLKVSGNPVPLETKFVAVVDGTDGDTYLNAVSATFLKTSLTAKGAIVGAEGVKGRTVRMQTRIEDGRIEDILRLVVKGNDPLMSGQSPPSRRHEPAGRAGGRDGSARGLGGIWASPRPASTTAACRRRSRT